jgi:predicted secreted protein
MHELREAEQGSGAQLAAGEELRVVLRENRTAGYRWRLRRDGSPVLELVRADAGASTRAVSAPRGPLGAPRERSFVFRAVAAGRTRLEFVYERPWSGEEAPAKECAFVVFVT